MRIIEYLALFFLAHSGVSSTPISFCPGDSDVCLQWAVPEDANESSSKNIYFQIEAPTSYQWIGLGIGNQMAGAVIFVMYEDGEGNVTVSHREGKGHTMPLALEHGGITLLSGSGIKDGNMVANVRYAQPDDIGLSGDSSWIMARKEGASLASTDADQSITVHDEHFAFSVDLSQALVSSDVNPFDTTDSDGATPPPSSGGVKEQDSNPNQQLILAHGIMMTVVFVAVYPLGSLLMPLLGKWYIHAGWQMVGFSAMWAAFGIGYVVSDRLDIFFDQAHTRLGVFVVALLSIQPLLGIFHHVQYRRQKKRGLFGHVHIWYGRFTIILGIVNGGLGLQLTGASNGYVIAYSVVAGVSTLIYAGFSVAKVPVLKKKQRDLALW